MAPESTYDVFVGVLMTSLPVFRQMFGYSTLLSFGFKIVLKLPWPLLFSAFAPSDERG